MDKFLKYPTSVIVSILALLAVVISAVLSGVWVYFKVHPVFIITGLFTFIPLAVLVKYFVFSKDKS